MDTKIRHLFTKSSGQTMVEYILLTAVVIGVFSFFMQTSFMQKLVSPDGQFTNGLFRSMQFCYRHAIYGDSAETYPTTYLLPKHLSYSTGSDTRFFGPSDPYPSD